MKTEHKVAVITGASSGLGTAIAQQLYAENYCIALHGRDRARLEAVARDFDDQKRVVSVVGDISKDAHRLELITATIKAFDRIDALINNAGAFAPKPFLEVTEEDVDLFLETNLKGTYFLTQLAIPHLLEQGGGSVINIGTVLVDHALGGFPATAPLLSKGGLHAFTVQLAAEFGKQNIRVNTIAPGIIRTPLHDKNGIEDAESLAALHLLNRIGEPAHIATTTAHLLANDFISGAVINVDGGHVAGHNLG